jgi:Zn-finger nucleic acid-binding protein
MRTLTVDGVTVDRCRKCGGLWLDLGEKERLLARPEAVRAADTGPPVIGRHMDEQREIRCPRDGAVMVPVADPRQRHVRFESCSVCGGVFLDAGELTDLSELTLLERLRTLLG